MLINEIQPEMIMAKDNDKRLSLGIIEVRVPPKKAPNICIVLNMATARPYISLLTSDKQIASEFAKVKAQAINIKKQGNVIAIGDGFRTVNCSIRTNNPLAKAIRLPI